MKGLVIGMGSVGQRHHAILTRMGLAMASASDSFSTSEFTSKTLDEGIINWNPEYVVVSNDTGKHQPIVMQLASLGFRGKLLVPLSIRQQMCDNSKVLMWVLIFDFIL